MRTITSNFETRENIEAALLAGGMEVIPKETGDAANPSTAVEAKPSESPASPGESPSGTEGKTTPAAEPGEKKPQETQAAPPVETKPAEPKPGEPKEAKTGFEPRRKQLEKQVARLHEDLDLERGSKATLQFKLDEAMKELAALKPAATEPAKKDEPVRPKRPTLAEHEYDQEKLEAALAQYDVDMEAYHQQVTTKTVNERLAAEETRRQQAAAKAEEEAANAKLALRIQEESKELPDWDELVDAMPEEPVKMPGVIEAAIENSENPGALVHYFMKDFLQNDGKELDRIGKLSPVLQVRALTRLEDKLVAEREAAKKKPVEPQPAATPAAAPAVAEPVKPPEAPAKPKPQAKPQPDPIEPVGSRAGASTPSLANLKGQEYYRARAQGVNH